MILAQNVPYVLRPEKAALKAFAKLSKEDYNRIWDALLVLCATGHGDVIHLKGYSKGSLRLRVGNYRVYLFVEGFVIEVIQLELRGEAYKTKSRAKLKK
jgi:mRNA-degrading endonuclease RelE of RelBE toxin-antitoxin system